MPLVGLCGEPKEALEKIEYMMQALSLQGQFSEEEPVRAEKNRQTEFVRITEKSAEALEALDCLIWSGSCENVLSEDADSLLEEYPRLAVIFVADSPDAVFDALTKPFFHVVRGYALEQDLKAALAKLKKQRRTGSGYRSFPYRESPSSDGRIRVREKEILYLESMRHEIWHQFPGRTGDRQKDRAVQRGQKREKENSASEIIRRKEPPGPEHTAAVPALFEENVWKRQTEKLALWEAHSIPFISVI